MAVHLIDNALVRHKIGILRDISTDTGEFRHTANELATLLIYEAAKTFRLEKKIVQGWAGPVEVSELCGKKLTVVPILRAGLGLMDGVLNLLPGTSISVVGLYRNESTLAPVEYYVKLAKDMPNRRAIILDPMLATGGSMISAIDILKKHGCENIISLNLVCAPEGLERVLDKHPDVEIFTSAIDNGLNDNGYILPGLGDAGDRIFGTR